MVANIQHRYVLWNNKGGVGKSTLTFHVSALYAERHPRESVLVVDLCPQANTTTTLLGGGRGGEEHLLTFQNKPNPETIVGYIQHQLQYIGAVGTAPHFDVGAIVKRVCQYNINIPPNVFLVPGDGNLEVVLTPMSYYANPQAMTQAWKNVLLWARHLCNLAAETLPSPVTIFIDTNPSFALYTQQAILASDLLLIPFNADDSSRMGVGALFGLIYGLNTPHPVYEQYTFHKLADQARLALPKIKLFIGNRFTQYQGSARAFAGLADAIREQSWDVYKRAPEVFEQASHPISNADEFAAEYCVDLRDFNTAGVVALHQGTPLTRLQSGTYKVYGTEARVHTQQIESCQKALDQIVSCLT